MSYKDLIYSVDETIATITLNRPERMNALTPRLEAEMHRAFDAADQADGLDDGRIHAAPRMISTG